MIKPLEGDRWGKQETTSKVARDSWRERVEKVTEKENEETKDKQRWWKNDEVNAR